VRAEIPDVRQGGSRLLDVRSLEEFVGAPELDARPGHIPGARHLDWRDLAGPREGSYLAPSGQLQAALATVGIRPGQVVLAYCRTGMRAALGYIAQQQLGYTVRVFDGSYQAWAAAGLPVESGPTHGARI